MWPPETAVKVDARGFVSVGRPFPEVDITILQDGQPAGPGEIGDIAITSPANTDGYFNNPQATADLFLADDQVLNQHTFSQKDPDEKGFLKRYQLWRQKNPMPRQPKTILSGDLGYLDEAGNLTIVGRQKNIIIQAGETVYAAEIEEVVNEITAVRYAAAVGIDQDRIEGERVTIFAEVRIDETSDDEMYQEIIIDIVQRFQARFGFRPGIVYLLKPKTIPMTYNGKLQHQKLKEMFNQGDLRRDGRILYPDY
jgi:acyl-CoA synthetase (AMP-forming)/AMP-acid ligase II